MSAIVTMPRTGAEDVVDMPRQVWSSLSVTSSHASLSDEWRALEQSGLATPYQRHDWIAAYAATVGAAHQLDLRHVSVRDAAQRLIAIFPLVITRRNGARHAGFIGDKHANYHMAVLDRSFAASLDRAGIQALLEAIAATLGDIDAFVFTNQPPLWDGIINPLTLLDSSPSPSNAYKMMLSADADATLARSMSTHARKKLKNKRHRLRDFGPVQVFRATTDEQIDAILKSFLAHKAVRFAQMGVVDPFTDPSVQAFFRSGAAMPADGQCPPIEMYGLQLGDDIIASCIGAVHAGRFTGMATAFDLDHPAAKTSPGEVLIVDVVRHKCRDGFTMLDLGVGEARYKTTICDEIDALVDTCVGITWRGRALVLTVLAKRALLRTVKKHPRLHALAHRLATRRASAAREA